MTGAEGTALSALPDAPAPRWGSAFRAEPGSVLRLQEELGLPETLCALLEIRGYSAPEEAKRHLRPLLEHLHDPGRLADGRRARDRILEAVERGETILVHGDYDVDGICGAALLTRWIRAVGGTAVAFVPHRLEDGYDFGPAGLRAAREEGASLVVTVDCGIRAHEAVASARKEGIDVVVTDHHTPGPSLPPAAAVVNPARDDCPYPVATLSGAGLAFQICRLLAEARGRPDEALWRDLDLVAVATVADLVPLAGENRILVRYGLRALGRTRKPGLQALLERCGIGSEDPDAGQVGFRVAPRINAAGRMGDPTRALRLLLTEDREEAEALAEELEEANDLRREEDRSTLAEALELLARNYDPETDYGVVLASKRWHPGIIGIVASRVVERIHRPTVLVALEGDRGRGSARSIPGFHLFETVEACGEHLLRFGGHRQAAGMEVAAGEVDAFRRAFQEEARRRLEGRSLRPAITPDLEIRLGEADEELHRYLRHLGPFGIGNPRPVFLSRGLEVPGGARVVGEDHLKLRLRQDGRELEGIGFRLADRVPPESVGGGPVDALYQLRENEYRGRVTLQARLLDLRPSLVRGG